MKHSKHLLKRIVSVGAALLIAATSIQAPVLAQEQEMDFFDDVVIEQQTAEENKTDEVPVIESEPAKAEQEGTVIDFDEPEEAASVMTMKKQPTGEPGIGYLKPGADLNIVFKKLAGHSDATADTIDTNIHQVKIRVPSKHITDTVEGTPVTISDGSSSAEVVAYYQDNTLWLYSEETDIIQFNEHCNGMFAGLEGLENVYLFDDAADTSRITDAEDMFAGDVSIAEVDLSSFNASNLNTVQRMFEGCDALATLRLGSNWKFTGSASLPDKNWKSSKDGSVWTTAALETKFTKNDTATFTATGDSATVDTDILYVGSGLKSGNMQEVHTKVPFTGYCINDTNHDPYGYYDKIEATAGNLVKGELLSSDDHGYGTFGKDMREALITLIYYGTESGMKFGTLQKDIWHFTDHYSDDSWSNSFWDDKKFSDIPDHESLKLYIYKSRDGYQNVLSIEGVEKKLPDQVLVSIVKKNPNNEFVAGATLKVNGTAYNGSTMNEITIQTQNNKIYSVKLLPGEYTLSEFVTPEGYKKAADISFKIEMDGKVVCDQFIDSKIVMIDYYDPHTVVISKQNVAGKEIAGAKLVVRDAGKNEIDSWTSVEGESHNVSLLPGTYTLTETQAPAGFDKAGEITFTVGIDGSVTSERFIDGKLVMVDQASKFSAAIKKTDVAGKEIAGAELTVTKDGTEKVVDQWTSEEGKSHIVKGLEQGSYTLTEKTAPKGYEVAESIKFKITDEGKVMVDSSEVTEVVMTDKYTEHGVVISKQNIAGAEIAGAKLSVSNSKGKEIDSWTSVVGKDHLITGLVPDTYTLKEDVAPKGYLKSESIQFTIDLDGKVKVNDQEVEKVVMTDKYDDHTVTFSKQDIAGKEIEGAVITVTDENDHVVETWTSKADESHQISNMLPGTYTMTETTAPKGYKKSESITFVIAADGSISVGGKDVESVVMTDAYEEYNVVISKQNIVGEEIPGAKLTVKNASTGKVVETWTSVKDQSHTITVVPGTYTLTEDLTPTGYSKAESITFLVALDGTVTIDSKAVKTVVMTDLYKGFDVVISKQDIAGKEIAGAKLTVTGEDNKVKDSWTSEAGKSHTIKDLQPGTYVLTEVTAPTGYEKAESITFKLSDSGVVTVGGENVKKVVMTDKYTPRDITISKQDPDGNELAGAKLTLTDSSKKTVESWTTEASAAHIVKGLVPGTYTVREDSAPAGYLKASDITFTLKLDGTITINNKTVSKIVMIDEAEKFQITVRKVYDNNGTETLLQGAHMTITHKNKELTVTDASWTTDKTAKTIDLAADTYLLTETQAPVGYNKAASISFVIDKDGTMTVNGSKVANKTLTMVDTVISDKFEVVIEKQDDTGKLLAGAVLEVKKSDNSKEAIANGTWTSTSSAGQTLNLTPGQYVLKETTAPSGYSIASDITFTVANDGKVTVGNETVSKIVVKDVPTRVSISKTDADSGSLLAGAALQVLDSNKNVIESWTSTTSAYEIKGKLNAGAQYTLHETSAPNGYNVACDITFTVNKDGSVLNVTMKDSKTAQPSNGSGDIKITKTVAGAGGDQSKRFTFTITLKDSKGNPITGNYKTDANGKESIISMSNGGTATFELSHGQYLVIKGVEAGVVYTITENDYSNEGYKTTVQNSNKATATGENLVAFTNTKDSVDANTTTGTVNQAQTMYTTTSAVTSGRSTGDASHLILWSLGILAAGAVLGITIYKRRKHN